MNKKIIFIIVTLIVIPVIWVAAKKIIQSDKTTNISVLPGEQIAYFSGGCFWCTEKDFEKLPGVREVISGFLGGEEENPSYRDVVSGNTGHREGVAVYYDPKTVSFRDLIIHHIKTHDPTDSEGSFFDRGFQYTSAIYYQNDQERITSREVIQELSPQFPEPIVTSVEAFTTFFVAEDYHQDFYKNNPIRYNAYRLASGRDAYIKSVWGENSEYHTGVRFIPDITAGDNPIVDNPWSDFVKPESALLRQILSPLSYYVTQGDGTERAFTKGNMHDNNEEGIYVDIVSGEPLYSSTDKFDSGTGWPSFSKAIDDQFITYHEDNRFFVERTEIRSRYADSHLGHVFADNPLSETGLRHCINGAALDFIPLEEMENQGYGDYLYLFE